MPQLPGTGWGSGPRAAPPHAPPPHSCGGAGSLPGDGGGGASAQCGGRSRVGMRPRPRPLSPGWEGERCCQGGVPAGDALGRGCSCGHHPPARRCPGSEGPGPRAHPPARGIQPGDRRRRRPCPAPGSVCNVSRGGEGSAHRRRAGGAAEAASLGAGRRVGEVSRDAGDHPVRGSLRFCWSLRSQVRPAVCGKGPSCTCATAPCRTTPPSMKPGQGTSRNSQFLESRRLPGPPGGWRRTESGPGEGRRRPGKLKHR